MLYEVITFSRFEEEGIFSQDAGLDYKNIILAQGASKDEMRNNFV